MENRTVIHEEKEDILRTFQNAEANISLLNEINRLKPFNEIETVLAWSKDTGLIQKLFFDENPEAEKLAKISRQEFIYPPHLLNLERFLKSVNNQTGTFASYDSKKKIWVLNIEAIEACNDRYRKFATSPDEVARWEFAKKYCDFINSFSPGTQARKNFAHEIAVIVASPEGYRLAPDWRFVTKEFRY